MKQYVIDVNILFSGLVSRKPFYERLFALYEFYTPDFALVELEKYRQVFLKKVKGDRSEFEEFALLIFSRLTVVPDFVLRNDVKERAKALCEPVDIKDSLYVALADQLQYPLITRDVPLYNHLKANGFVSIILFDDFLRTTEII